MSFRYNGKGVREISFESLAQPLMHVQERHDRLEDNINLMDSQAAQLDYIIKKEEEINPDSPIVKQYKGYLDNIRNIADTLSTKGVLDNTNVRNQVSKLNTAFNRDILPISIGNERRERQIALENELRIKNPNLLFTRRANTADLSEFMNNTYKTDVLDLNTVMAEGANIGNILSSLTRGEKINKSEPGYLKVTKMLGFDPVDALVKGNVDLDNLINMYYQKQSSTYNSEIMNTNEKVVKNAFVKGVYSTLKSNDQSQYMNDKQWDVNQQRANIDYQFAKQAEWEAKKQAEKQATELAAQLSIFTPTKNYVTPSGTTKTLSTKEANSIANQIETNLPSKVKSPQGGMVIPPQGEVAYQIATADKNRLSNNVTNLRNKVEKVYPQTKNWTNEEVITYLRNTAPRNQMIAQNAYTITNIDNINRIVEKILPDLTKKNYKGIDKYLSANEEGKAKYKGGVNPRIVYFGGNVMLDFYKEGDQDFSVDITKSFNNIATHNANGSPNGDYFLNINTQLDNIFKKPLTEENRVKAAESVAQLQMKGLTFLSTLAKE